MNEKLSDEAIKRECNNFVWMFWPSRMPLGEADDVALKLFEMYLDAHSKYPAPEAAIATHPND